MADDEARETDDDLHEQPIDDDAALMLMLRDLLADRFKLALHRETRTMQALVLEAAKNGPRLEKAEGGNSVTTTSSSAVLSDDPAAALESPAALALQFVIRAHTAKLSTPGTRRPMLFISTLPLFAFLMLDRLIPYSGTQVATYNT